ncbi:MAG: efflux RND transporter permease subunit [Syntrophobacteria bacterium]|nr:efflux RND transporter permease subunit [Deltaproteobacteria bacterium]MDH3896547.1 efflux RND transporter permease subunit [Deltaproteobacteria bacterium]MDH3949884.1 efflux RND transporter permease subunit [Deltaproteobacteria bacterium]
MKPFFRYVLRQTVLVNLLFALAMAVGLFSLFDLPVERYPDVQMGKVQINTVLPGASPEEVESLITDEIEEALDDLESVEFIRSTSYRERSMIMVKFIDDTDYDKLYEELRLKVLGIMNELPNGIDPPRFTEIRVSEWLPVASVNLIGDRTNRALSLMAEEMKLHLRQIPGVKEVQLNGEYIREFHVYLNPRLLDKYGVTFDEVARALSEANISLPAGHYTDDGGEFVIVVDERYRSRQQIAETIIRRDSDGSFLTVGNVLSSARMSYRDPYVITSVNGKDCVTLRVIKTEDGNALDIMPMIEEIMARFQPLLEKEEVDAVLTQDQRVYIDDSISTLGMNLLVGICLVSVLIFFFMGLRNAILTMVGIPFSFLVTMIIMWLLDSSLNEITLFSFVLVSGIIVDDAIVVVENIYRHLQEGEPLEEAVINGVSEVAAPVIAATSTTVAAFLPMLIMSGSTGEFFAQIPIAVAAAIVASLFECLIILPSHFIDWPGWRSAEKEAVKPKPASKERWVMSLLLKGTNRLVDFSFRHRFKSLGLVMVAFVASVFILAVSISGKIPLIKIKFFPDEYTYYYIELEGPVATPIETTNLKLKEITEFILPGRPGQLRSATGMAGFYVNEDYQPVFGSNLGYVYVEMPRKEEQNFPENHKTDPIVHLDYVRKQLARFEQDGWSVRVRPEKSGPPTGKDINVRVVGPDPEMVKDLAQDVYGFLNSNDKIAPHLIDLSDNLGRSNRVYRFRVDKERAAEYGLTPLAVSRLAASVLDGRFVGDFRTHDEDVDLKLKIDEKYLDAPEAALSIPILQHPSGPLRLGDLTTTESYIEPNKLDRYQTKRAITLTANIRPGAQTSTPAVVNAIGAYYQAIKGKYPGAEISFSGEFESTRRSYTSLAYAFFVALLIMYVILATQFRSYLQPLIILSAVVFSLIGVVFGKFVTQGLFTVNSFIAVVGVTGVVVNDSLVLIDFINRSYRSGMSRREAINHGIRTRLRPILLTTLTTSLGLAPMAFGIPSYSVVWGSMASTFVTGLCTATFLTLFIVPIEWDLLMGLKLRWEGWRQGRALDFEQ